MQVRKWVLSLIILCIHLCRCMQSAITTKLNTIFNQINKSDKFAKVKKIIAVVVIVIPHAGFILK